MADYWSETPDYLERHRTRRTLEAMRERRRSALSAVSKLSYQVTTDGQSLRELVFDAPPTLGELLARAGGDARLVSVGRHWLHTASRPAFAAE